MLRLERSRKAKGSHSPVGIRIRISDSSTTETGRRTTDSRIALGPLTTMTVTSSMVAQAAPSTALMTSPCTSVPSRSAGPPVEIAPTVTSPSHRSTAMPNVPLAESRTTTTSNISSCVTEYSDLALRSDGSSMELALRDASAAARAPSGKWAPISAGQTVEAEARRRPSAVDEPRRPSKSGRRRSTLCLAALSAAFSAAAASTFATAAAISTATRASASALALLTASATAASLSCASIAVARATSAAATAAAASAARSARSPASLASRSCRASDQARYSRLALMVRIRCCASAAAALFSLYFLRMNQPCTECPITASAPFLRLDSAILRTSNGTTTATSIEARSSRKPPHPALRKSLVMPSA
mmetsp:Transcript_25609/g.82712  ORF Transcript_25609/g.82712 Transcript_25609/m.82712 type:complete len:362 (+) Transcript_25609:2226-3311(+)